MLAGLPSADGDVRSYEVVDLQELGREARGKSTSSILRHHLNKHYGLHIADSARQRKVVFPLGYDQF